MLFGNIRKKEQFEAKFAKKLRTAQLQEKVSSCYKKKSVDKITFLKIIIEYSDWKKFRALDK